MENISFKIYKGDEPVKEYLKINKEARSWDKKNMCFNPKRNDVDLDALLSKKVIMYYKEEMIGYGSIMFEFSFADKESNIGLAYVIKPKYRNKGYGNYLLKYLIKYCKENYSNCNKIKVSIYKNNFPSITLAENNGFDFDDFDDSEIHFSKKI